MPYVPNGSVTMIKGKKVLIACSMIEDELNEAIRKHKLNDIEIIWMERGHHSKPENLNVVVMEAIAEAEKLEPEYILLAYGLCGNGAVGWKSERATLVIPKFDDCINMMLCPEVRRERNNLQTGRMYLTRGWIQEKGSVGNMIQECCARYGDRKGLSAVKVMLEAYHHLTVIDTGCYNLGPVQDYARRYASLLGFRVDTVKGSDRVMEKLLLGEWDDDIIVKKPGDAIAEADFTIYR